MGYHVHITREADWTESESDPITLDEWNAYVASDGEMCLESADPRLAVWTAYSGHDVDGNRAWFDYRKGRIVVKNPDDEILAKMCAIADRFDAEVVGDDGESYDARSLVGSTAIPADVAFDPFANSPPPVAFRVRTSKAAQGITVGTAVGMSLGVAIVAAGHFPFSVFCIVTAVSVAYGWYWGRRERFEVCSNCSTTLPQSVELCTRCTRPLAGKDSIPRRASRRRG